MKLLKIFKRNKKVVQWDHNKCECGGKFKKESYVDTVMNDDDNIPYIDLYNCKCNKCGQYAMLDFIPKM